MLRYVRNGLSIDVEDGTAAVKGGASAKDGKITLVSTGGNFDIYIYDSVHRGRRVAHYRLLELSPAVEDRIPPGIYSIKVFLVPPAIGEAISNYLGHEKFVVETITPWVNACPELK